MAQNRINRTGASTAAPPTLTRGLARQLREARDAGYLFPLTVTGATARVRVPNVADKTFLGQLPRRCQEVLADELLRMQNGGEAIEEITTQEEAIDLFDERIGGLNDLADELVKFCFIDPKVVDDDQITEHTPQDVVGISDIHIEDRLEFAALVMQGEGAAKRRLKTFRPGPVGSVSPAPRNQAAPTALELSQTR